VRQSFLSGKERLQWKLKGNRISLLGERGERSERREKEKPWVFSVESRQEQPGISIFRRKQRREARELAKKWATHFLLQRSFCVFVCLFVL
jgi:hypothetical protein